MYIADPTPIGTAINAVKTSKYRLEIIIGNIPPDLPESTGLENINSKSMKGSPLIRMYETITRRIATVIIPDNVKNIFFTKSILTTPFMLNTNG